MVRDSTRIPLGGRLSPGVGTTPQPPKTKLDWEGGRGAVCMRARAEEEEEGGPKHLRHKCGQSWMEEGKGERGKWEMYGNLRKTPESSSKSIF